MTARRLLLAALVLAGSADHAAAQDPAVIASRASRAYRTLTSFRADFHQVIEDRMIGTQESRGELIQSGEVKLVMRFSDPRGDAIVIDGTHVWIYTPSTTPGQVIRAPVSHDPVYGPNVLARLLDRPAERYELAHVGTETIDGAVTDAVEFVPNTADPLVRRATVWIDRREGLPRRLEFMEIGGVRRTLHLSRIRTNLPLARDTFVFQVPSGVRVIER